MKYKQRAQFERHLWSEVEHRAQLASVSAEPSPPPACALPNAPTEFFGMTDAPFPMSIPDT